MTGKPCNKCSAEISWKQEGEKWIPMNADGTEHKTTCGGSKSVSVDPKSVIEECTAFNNAFAEIDAAKFDALARIYISRMMGNRK